jgi:hypothetical protein
MISPNGDCHPVKGFNDFNGPAQTTNLGQRTQIAAQQRTIAWISMTAIGAKRTYDESGEARKVPSPEVS